MINGILFTLSMLTIQPDAPTPYETITVQPVEWSHAELVRLVEDTFPEAPDTAVRIVNCESRFNPNAVSPTDDHGLFQINRVHFRQGGVAHGVGAAIYDPVVNSQVARAVYDEAGGFTPWTCYWKG